MEARGEDPLIDCINLGARNYDGDVYGSRWEVSRALAAGAENVHMDLETVVLNEEICSYYFEYVYETTILVMLLVMMIVSTIHSR